MRAPTYRACAAVGWLHMWSSTAAAGDTRPRARPSRKGGRDHFGTVGEIISESRATFPGIRSNTVSFGGQTTLSVLAKPTLLQRTAFNLLGVDLAAA